MMNLTRHFGGLACYFLLPFVASAAEPDARTVFNKLFAERIKQVTATADRADDIALSKELVSAAQGSAKQPELLAIMCHTAYDISRKTPEGLPTALEAMQLLADSVPTARASSRLKMADIHMRLMQTAPVPEREQAGASFVELLVLLGDERALASEYEAAVNYYRRAVPVAAQFKLPAAAPLKGKLDMASLRFRAQQRMASLGEALLKDATNHAAAEELVLLHVVDLDAPAGAKPYLNRVKDAELRKLATLAAGDQATDEASNLALGDWYSALADQAAAPAQPVMWSRSRGFYARYLQLHTADDLSRKQAELSLKRLDERLGDVGPLVSPVVPTAPRIDPQDGRSAVPEQAAQAQAEKTVKGIFKDLYGKRTQSDLAVLGKKLFEQGMQTTADPVARFVLLREARDAAAQAADVETSRAAIDELARVYSVDAIEMTSAALATASKAAKSAEAFEAIAGGYVFIADAAITADRYDAASALLAKAESAAKSARSVSLVAQVQTQRKDLADLQQEYQRVRVAEKTLVDQPDDPGACFAVGRFLCLTKKDWARGLPLLAKGSDAAVAAVAQKELSAPTSAAGQVEVADGWWELGDKARSTITKRKLLQRARHWYELAAAGATGLTRAHIDKRLDDIDQASASGAVVDLLALIDPKKDAFQGAWEKSGLALLSPKPVAQAGLQIPYIPPVEYDLKMTVEKKDIHVLYLGLPLADGMIGVDIDNQSTSGGLKISDNGGKNNIVKYNACYTAIGKPATIICSVRKTSVTVAIDGKVILRYEGDLGSAKPLGDLKPPNPKALAIGSWGAWVFTKITLIPITGQGKRTR